mmetsp:Transcript_36553/g.86868  ORF Transcript_36553/g.86868 Transcript_36553/m.86868 type:complete len:151 (+) Transcript_36553:271-723(+)
MSMSRHIAAAIDLRFREGVEAVCRFASIELHKEGDVVDLICVLSASETANVDGPLVAKIREDLLSTCSEEVGSRLVHEVPYEVHVVVVDGLSSASVVEAIIDVSRKLEAAVVVVGTHGRGRMQEMFLGSVASGLLKKCPLPLAIARPPRP